MLYSVLLDIIIDEHLYPHSRRRFAVVLSRIIAFIDPVLYRKEERKSSIDHKDYLNLSSSKGLLNVSLINLTASCLFI